MSYRIYESYQDEDQPHHRAYYWLTIQYVSLTIPGHNEQGYAVQNLAAGATYLLPVTVVASVNYRPDRNDGDYAAYIGVAPPSYTIDPARVAYIAAHGNKIEGALAEHLFRAHLNTRYGTNVIRYRA